MNGKSITVQEIASAGLAYLLVGGAIAYSFVEVIVFHSLNSPPDWLTLGVGAAIGFYFGNRAATTALAQSTNGMSDVILKAASQAREAALQQIAQLPPPTTPPSP